VETTNGVDGIRKSLIAALVLLPAVACGTAEPVGTQPGTRHGSHAPGTKPLRDGERFQVVSLERAYRPAPPGGGTDDYRCFLVDPKLTETAYLTGSQVLPQNTGIVHHGMVYQISPSDVAQARRQDARTEGDGWRCFGSDGLETQSNFVGGWAPGHEETLIGERTGYRLEPGSQILLQLHYNLLSNKGEAGPTDQSSVRLRLLPDTGNVTPLVARFLPAPVELPCAPGESGPLCDRDAAIADLAKRSGTAASEDVAVLNRLCNKGRRPVAGNTQHCDHRVPRSALLYAIAPHMHLLGRSISVELNPGTPAARTLLHQPSYDFDDQSVQVLPHPVRLEPRDTIRVTCTHDATLRSELPQLDPLEPRYVVAGEGTSDEMCVAVLTMTPKP
jgi:hypothetical protein